MPATAYRGRFIGLHAEPFTYIFRLERQTDYSEIYTKCTDVACLPGLAGVEFVLIGVHSPHQDA